MQNWNLIALKQIDSTNEEAKRIIAKNQQIENSVVWAESQTKGKGRLDRKWESPCGNLYCSFIVKNENAHLMGFTTAVAVIEAIKNYVEDENKVKSKWPNDVLVEGKKISGILLEVYENYLIIGVGINVNSHPENSSYPTTNLLETGENVRAYDVLESLSESLLDNINLLKNKGFVVIREKWLQYAYKIGEKIQVNLINESTKGTFKGISEQGALILQTNSEIRNIIAGDVFYL